MNLYVPFQYFLSYSTSCAILRWQVVDRQNFVTPQPNKVTLAQAAAWFFFMIWQFARERERESP